MSDVREAAPRLEKTWFWWSSLDAGVQRVLNDIALRAPQAVAEVIGGPDADLLLPAGDVSFGDHLWTQASANRTDADVQTGMHTAPEITIVKGLRTDNQRFRPGHELRFTWTEQNRGRREESPRTAKIIVQDETGEIVAEAEELLRGLWDDRAVEQEIRVDTLGIADGRYWAKLFVPYAQGMEFTPGGEAEPALELHAGEASAGAVKGATSPADAFATAAASLAAAAAAIDGGDGATAQTQFADALTTLRDAFTSMGSLDTFSGMPHAHALSGSPQNVSAALRQASMAAGSLGNTALRILATGGSVQDHAEARTLEHSLRQAAYGGRDESDQQPLQQDSGESRGTYWDQLAEPVEKLRVGAAQYAYGVGSAALEQEVFFEGLREVIRLLAIDCAAVDTLAEKLADADPAKFTKGGHFRDTLKQLLLDAGELAQTASDEARAGRQVHLLPAARALVEDVEELAEAVR